MRYVRGIITWKKDAMQNLDKDTRELMTINKEFNPNSDVYKVYVCRKDGGEVLVIIESCIKSEENNLAWYVRHSTEDLLDIVKLYGYLNIRP